MGEYAIRVADDKRVKIGTCENLTGLRYDQRELVRYGGSWDGVFYRFPFPSEDAIAPGDFTSSELPLRVDGWSIPADWKVRHMTIQFTAEREGYLVSLPCPEAIPDQTYGTTEDGYVLRVGKNGFHGALFLVGQKIIYDELGGKHLVPLLRCVCGTLFNLGTDYATFESLAVALRSNADTDVRWNARRGETETDRSRALHTIADRILSGYNL